MNENSGDYMRSIWNNMIDCWRNGGNSKENCTYINDNSICKVRNDSDENSDDDYMRNIRNNITDW